MIQRDMLVVLATFLFAAPSDLALSSHRRAARCRALSPRLARGALVDTQRSALVDTQRSGSTVHAIVLAPCTIVDAISECLTVDGVGLGDYYDDEPEEDEDTEEERRLALARTEDAPHLDEDNALHLVRRRARARALLDLGAVYVSPPPPPPPRPPRPKPQRVAFAASSGARELARGAYVRVHSAPKRYARACAAAGDWRARVVHRDARHVVVCKPRGVPTHAAVDNLRENCCARVATALGGAAAPPLRACHRLDVDTTGLLVLATTAHAARAFDDDLRADRVRKQCVGRAALRLSPLSGAGGGIGTV